MPERTSKNWKKIRHKLAGGEKVKGLAQDFGLSYEAITKRSVREKCRNPGKIARRAREKLVSHNAVNEEEESDILLERYPEANLDAAEASLLLLRRFGQDVEEGAVRIKNIRELAATDDFWNALQASTGSSRSLGRRS